MDFNKLLVQARRSRFGLWKLNFLLQRFVPFNKPHGLKVICIEPTQVQVEMPYQKTNLNHIKGLHACGMATAAEYASGLLLLSRLGMKNYRLIMESLSAEYFYQGKSTAIASYCLTEEQYQNQVLRPLEKDGITQVLCEIKLHDKDQNHLCTVSTKWQVKDWKKVKTQSN